MPSLALLSLARVADAFPLPISAIGVYVQGTSVASTSDASATQRASDARGDVHIVVGTKEGALFVLAPNEDRGQGQMTDAKGGGAPTHRVLTGVKAAVSRAPVVQCLPSGKHAVVATCHGRDGVAGVYLHVLPTLAPPGQQAAEKRTPSAPLPKSREGGANTGTVCACLGERDDDQGAALLGVMRKRAVVWTLKGHGAQVTAEIAVEAVACAWEAPVSVAWVHIGRTAVVVDEHAGVFLWDCAGEASPSVIRRFAVAGTSPSMSDAKLAVDKASAPNACVVNFPRFETSSVTSKLAAAAAAASEDSTAMISMNTIEEDPDEERRRVASALGEAPPLANLSLPPASGLVVMRGAMALSHTLAQKGGGVSESPVGAAAFAETPARHGCIALPPYLVAAQTRFLEARLLPLAMASADCTDAAPVVAALTETLGTASETSPSSSGSVAPFSQAIAFKDAIVCAAVPPSEPGTPVSTAFFASAKEIISVSMAPLAAQCAELAEAGRFDDALRICACMLDAEPRVFTRNALLARRAHHNFAQGSFAEALRDFVQCDPRADGGGVSAVLALLPSLLSSTPNAAAEAEARLSSAGPHAATPLHADLALGRRYPQELAEPLLHLLLAERRARGVASSSGAANDDFVPVMEAVGGWDAWDEEGSACVDGAICHLLLQHYAPFPEALAEFLGPRGTGGSSGSWFGVACAGTSAASRPSRLKWNFTDGATACRALGRRAGCALEAALAEACSDDRAGLMVNDDDGGGGRAADPPFVELCLLRRSGERHAEALDALREMAASDPDMSSGVETGGSGRARRAARAASLYCVEALPASLDSGEGGGGGGTARRDDLALKHLATWVAAVSPTACLDALAKMSPPIGRRAALAALSLAEENAQAAAMAKPAAAAANDTSMSTSAPLRVRFLETRCAQLAASRDSGLDVPPPMSVDVAPGETLDACVEELAALFVEVVLAHRAASPDVSAWEREPLASLAQRAAEGALDAAARLRLLELLGAPMNGVDDGVSVGSDVDDDGGLIRHRLSSRASATASTAALSAPLACSERLLGRLPPGMLLRERAALLGRIGQREAALAALACELGDLRAAEAYAGALVSDAPATANSPYTALLKVLLRRAAAEEEEGGGGTALTTCLELLARHGEHVDAQSILPHLPSGVSLSRVPASVLSAAVCRAGDMRRRASVVRALRRAEWVGVQSALADATSRRPVYVDGSETCTVCGRRIGASAFAVEPQTSKLRHYACHVKSKS